MRSAVFVMGKKVTGIKKPFNYGPKGFNGLVRNRRLRSNKVL